MLKGGSSLDDAGVGTLHGFNARRNQRTEKELTKICTTGQSKSAKTRESSLLAPKINTTITETERAETTLKILCGCE